MAIQYCSIDNAVNTSENPRMETKHAGHVIKRCLEDIGEGNSWLARKVGVTPSAVRDWVLTGRIATDKAFAVADVLGITVYELFDYPVPEGMKSAGSNTVAKEKVFLAYVDAAEMEILTSYRQSTDMGKETIRAASVGAQKQVPMAGLDKINGR